MSDFEQALKDLAEGHPVFIYDADGREEETDIVFISEFVEPEDVMFMRKQGGGLICTTITDNIAEIIGLPFLVDVLKSAEDTFPIITDSLPSNLPYDTKSAFSLTVNHRNNYTGITDKDRAMTISEIGKLVEAVSNGLNNDKAARSFTDNFRNPGHLFLLRTSRDILKDRFGHTELSTAMAIMAEQTPSATICEMMGNDGNALSKDLARKFAQDRDLQFLEGAEVVEEWKKWCE